MVRVLKETQIRGRGPLLDIALERQILRVFELSARYRDDAGPVVSFVRGDVGEAFGSSRTPLSIKKQSPSITDVFPFSKFCSGN
jgi:hypothetical protein